MPDSEPLPALKTDPRFGYYPRWPEDGDAWVHPEDVALARQLIPSLRIWRVDAIGGPTSGNSDSVRPMQTIGYGATRLRVRPAMWQPTPEPAYAFGDWVEVLAADHRHEPHTGQVREIVWDEVADEIIYQLLVRGQPLPNLYRAAEIREVSPPSGEPEPVVNTPNPEQLDGVDELVDGLQVDEHNKRDTWW